MAKFSNPKSQIGELLQKMTEATPTYDSKRVGGEDHAALYRAEIKFFIKGQKHVYRGDSRGSKVEAEKSAAIKALEDLTKAKSSHQKKAPPKVGSFVVPPKVDSPKGKGKSFSGKEDLFKKETFFIPSVLSDVSEDSYESLSETDELFLPKGGISSERPSASSKTSKLSTDKPPSGSKVSMSSSSLPHYPRVFSFPPKEVKAPTRTALIVDRENVPKLESEVMDLIDQLDIKVVVNRNHPACPPKEGYDDNGVEVFIVPTGTNSSDTFISMLVAKYLLTDLYDTYLIGTKDKFAIPLINIIREKTALSLPKRGYQISRRVHIEDHL
jgi:hypothetical protein